MNGKAIGGRTLAHVGRHGQPPQRRGVPWELVGWGAFAGVLAAGVVLWFGASWVVAAFVAATGAVGLGLIALLSSVHQLRGQTTRRSERLNP